MVNHLLDKKDEKCSVKVITRFCLNDFLSGVSNLNALNALVQSGAEIKGVYGLHSKVYAFDTKSVILTSANFTSVGFFNNHEFGLISHNISTVTESIRIF